MSSRRKPERPGIRPTARPGIRPAGIVAALATSVALLSAPAAHADPATGHHSVRLTAGALKKLSDQYTPRTDGTPGLVAAARAASGGPSGTGSGKDASPQGSGATNGAKAAPHSATTDSGSSAGFQEESSWETPRGAASTLALHGTSDWVGVFSGGEVARYDANGNPVWQRTSHSLYKDWRVKPVNARQAEEFSPVLFQGYDPYQPSALGTHPFAQADFTHDGVDDIAVAYSVGASPARPFTSPGSDLQSGTFVSVLDGRTGAMLWHTLLPGEVGSLTVQDGKLIAADATGPDWGNDPVAEQGDSRSSLVAYSFHAASKSKLTGKKAWTYSTKAPWALWSDVEPAGDGLVTAGWTDTPMGLGNPRPADGHVVVVDTGTGRAVSDTKTPGYPRIVQRDPGSDKILVAEQNDPLDAVGWDLTTVGITSGKRSVITHRSGVIPEALAVNSGAHGKQPRYAVAELGINADLTDGQSSVSALDKHGHTTWTHQTSSTIGGANAPTLSLTYDSRGHGSVYAAVADAGPETSNRPEAPAHSRLIAFDARNGRTAWHKDGSVVGDQVTPYHGGLLTVGYGLTAYRTNPANGKATALPLLADTYAAVATDVNGDGVKDLVVGGESHGVFALDGRTLKAAQPRILWKSAVDASVRQLRLGKLKDSAGHTAQRVVAATSHGFAVLRPGDGKITGQVDTGTFQPGVAIARGSVVASGTALTAYTSDGAKVWSYRPAGTSGKDVRYSVPATDADGRLYLEYGGARGAFGTGPTDPAPTAVALDATNGKELWSEQPKSAAASWIEQQSGAFASPYIPGADGQGVAFAFGGDAPSTDGHLVQIVDGATGKVLSSDDSTGSPTFQGFAASPTYGLVELHTNLMTVYPADGGSRFGVRTMANVFQAAFATSTDGQEKFVSGTGGLGVYSLPFPKDESQFTYADSEQFALFAGSVTPVDLGKGKGTDLIALQRDWSAYDLNQQVGGFGADSFAIDSYQHGITVEKVTARSTGRSTAGTTEPKATQKAPAAPATAQAVEVRTLPIGTAVAPMHVQRSLKAEGANDTETTAGYTPQQIRARLGLTGDGTGQTTAITVAYDYPGAKADLNHFAAHFGLPQTCDSVAKGTDCFDFEQVYAEGAKPQTNANWNEEAALDIEWAHSVAPKAKIVLVEAADASAAALNRAVDTAASYHPAAVNNSWGMPEFSEESFYDGHCELRQSVCTQSTGDAGYPAGYSSTNPYALAIGGTHLVLGDDGSTRSETAWSSTGGGLSYFEQRPAYQDGVQSSPYRATPDVSFVADPRTGVAVYTSATGTAQWLEVGGTSLSSPIWAGIVTAADQLRAAAGEKPLAVAGAGGDTAHAAVYGLGDALSDITAGSNGACGSECTAGDGYDTVTGLGSPKAGIDAALAAAK
ncbi:S53 family peptidase [Streptomyces sp. NRRL F-5126]|uniref:S53 family peptidase n=1 Tax=Streptomyces sp. NRRL F-5126 TaxID=1463857 RepID=UPI0006899ADC|nr:hypothetical protein [Streptomyces sp. NRRL F-5126]